MPAWVLQAPCPNQLSIRAPSRTIHVPGWDIPVRTMPLLERCRRAGQAHSALARPIGHSGIDVVPRRARGALQTPL